MAAAVPSISITNPTPPRPSDTSPNVYRLLYRGALSLPDSLLLLDGLTFSARLDSPTKNNQLLQNPLALALESMRGRPSLRFMGVVNLHDRNLWWDESGGIELDIHVRATLTRIYFENIFCLTPFASTSKSVASTSPSTSDVGIKVALGDSDGPETTQVVIFARPSGGQDNRLNLIVARITARPPPAQAPTPRLPRPDDPTPRKPPAFYNGDVGGANNGAKRELTRVGSVGPFAQGRELKRVASVSNVNVKRKKLTNMAGNVVADLGSGVRLGDGKALDKGSVVFKVPEIPFHGRSNAKGKGKKVEGEEDVFGSADVDTPLLPQSNGKGKRKRGADEDVGQGEGLAMERANKDAIKRSTLDHLYKAKDPTAIKIDKSHPEFKDLFGWIYRGVGYALRADMNVRPVETNKVDQLIRMHMGMYLGGHGGSAVEAQGDRVHRDTNTDDVA